MSAPEIPELHKAPARRGLSGASLVWLVPLAALCVALFVGYQTYADRGPVIRVAFADAAGILPEETELRFRNVAVGLVEGVAFNEDLTRVLVDIRLDKTVAPFVDETAAFWIVRPEVTTSGVTGLDTVLSGVYLEGSWDTVPGAATTDFVGLEQAPLATAYRRGVEIELRSSRPSGLAENTPILFKGIEVGRLGPARIAQNGASVFAEAIIYEPHDRLISTATRFWDASGFSVSIGTGGAEIDFSSLSSLISGGITFDTWVSGGEPLRDGYVFEVFPDRATARNSVFEANDGRVVTFTMIFNENVSGLAADAPVEWRGVRIGRVANVTGTVDEARFGDARVRLLTTVEIKPSRFGLGGDQSEEAVIAYMEERVAEGLRARLATASILTGGLKVELVTVENAAPVPMRVADRPFPVFPVTASNVSDVSATAEGVFERVNALPVEELLDSAIGFLNSATSLVASDALRETPGEIRGLLAEARGVIGSPEVQALPGDVSALLAGLQGATSDLRTILATLQEADAVERLLAAVDEVGAAATATRTALEGVPALTENVTAFAATANALSLDAMVAEATALASDARALVASEAVAALPASVATAVDDLAGLLASLTEADTAGALNAALAEAAGAAGAVEAAVAGVPDIVARIDRIAASAEAVGLDTLGRELEGLLGRAGTLMGDASAADLPAALSGALGEAEAALADLRAGGLIESANATMASAQDAAAAIEDAAGELPALVSRLNATLNQAQATLGSFDETSEFGRETSSALREIERAAKAVTDLARTIERRPNSLILGR